MPRLPTRWEANARNITRLMPRKSQTKPPRSIAAAIPQKMAWPMAPFCSCVKLNVLPSSCMTSPCRLKVKAEVTNAMQLRTNSRRVLNIQNSLIPSLPIYGDVVPPCTPSRWVMGSGNHSPGHEYERFVVTFRRGEVKCLRARFLVSGVFPAGFSSAGIQSGGQGRPRFTRPNPLRGDQSQKQLTNLCRVPFQLSQELAGGTSCRAGLQAQTPGQFFQVFWVRRQLIQRQVVDDAQPAFNQAQEIIAGAQRGVLLFRKQASVAQGV